MNGLVGEVDKKRLVRRRGHDPFDGCRCEQLCGEGTVLRQGVSTVTQVRVHPRGELRRPEHCPDLVGKVVLARVVKTNEALETAACRGA